ncbi:MAG: response regulator transcription factor [Gammaproteobacteria bacterium]|nr:sigma-70 family RNA polymerase sigma factor [Gammaproteobacteria bacterium]NNC96701.1 response regulator transcription factor [Gammaproteobacteria bacterium]NNM13795.1 response regulator transcription factor [Gammaproteobacteria bacterium]
MSEEQFVYVVDDDDAVRDALGMLLESVDIPHQTYNNGLEFLETYDSSLRGCAVVDIRMPGMNGLELQKQLNLKHSTLPIIFITGHGDIPMAVEAIRNGAIDFMRKPIREQDLLDRIQEALSIEENQHEHQMRRVKQQEALSSLTKREREVFDLVAEGKANKVVAQDLGISERTVEVHRSQAMRKLGARSLAELVKIKLEAQAS